MTFAGLKKCIPMVRPLLETTPPISSMSRVLVFVQRMQEEDTMVSSWGRGGRVREQAHDREE